MPLKEPLNEVQKQQLLDKIKEIREKIDNALWEQAKEEKDPTEPIAQARVLDRVVHKFAEEIGAWLKVR